MEILELEIGRAPAAKSRIDTWKGVVPPIAGNAAALSDESWTPPAAKAICDTLPDQRRPQPVLIAAPPVSPPNQCPQSSDGGAPECRVPPADRCVGQS